MRVCRMPSTRIRTWNSDSSGSMWMSEARWSIAWARMLLTSSMTGASSASSRRWLTSSPRSSSAARFARAARSSRRSRSWLRASRQAQPPAGRCRSSISLAAGSNGSRLAARNDSPARQATMPLSSHQSSGRPLASIAAPMATASSGHSPEASRSMPNCSDSTGSSDSSDSAPRRTRMLPIRPPYCCWNASALAMSWRLASRRATSSSPSSWLEAGASGSPWAMWARAWVIAEC